MNKTLLLIVAILTVAGCSASIGTNPPTVERTTYAEPVASTTYVAPTETTVTETDY